MPAKLNARQQIYLADMDPKEALDEDRIHMPEDFDPEEEVKIHPNEVGHYKMAVIFLEAIAQALPHIKPSGETMLAS